MSDREESVRISRQLHVQETRGCIEKIFGYRHRRTFIYLQFVHFETNLLYHLPDYLEAFVFSVGIMLKV
jgi:hypothetical protein